MTCIPLVLLLDYGLSSSDGGLVDASSLPQWQYGIASSGPGGGPLWATRLDGPYLNDAEAVLTIPVPDLGGTTRPVLLLEHTYGLGAGDFVRLEADTGEGFEILAPIGGYPSPDGWRGGIMDWLVSGFDVTGLSLQGLRLRLSADAAGTGDGWYVRSLSVVDGDPIPPAVELIRAPSDTQDLGVDEWVEVGIDEDLGLVDAELVYDAGAGPVRHTLVEAGGLWSASIPAQPPGVEVEWRVEATDCEATTVVEGPPYRTFLAAPTELSGPTGPHLVARSAVLDWDPPQSPHPVSSYEVVNVSTGRTEPASAPPTSLPLEPGEPQDFAVRAIYDVGVGDPSETLSLEIEVPELTAVSPSFVYPGDRRYVALEGRSIYLLQGVSTVAFGDGVSVESFEVLDVGRAAATVAVRGDAEPGPREILVTGTQGTFGFEGVFEVADAASIPRIVEVTPSSLVQGEERTVVIRASQPFAGPVSVVVDEDFLVASVETEGDEVRVGLAALRASRPGEHGLVLDDGERLWDAVIEVDEFVFERSVGCGSGCAAAPGTRSWLSGWRRR